MAENKREMHLLEKHGSYTRDKERRKREGEKGSAGEQFQHLENERDACRKREEERMAERKKRKRRTKRQ